MTSRVGSALVFVGGVLVGIALIGMLLVLVFSIGTS